MQIYAFGHRKFVGKDTFVRFVIEQLRKKHRNLSIQRIGFADRLKAACHLMYGWAGHLDPAYYESNPEAKNQTLFPIGKTVRQVWIEVGNHMRLYDPGIWFNATLKNANCDILFITDLRFPNEITAVKETGGTIIKVNNPNVPYTDDDADRPLLDFKDWDQVVENEGTLNELYSKATQFVENIKVGSNSFF